jgi:hypothetical protein
VVVVVQVLDVAIVVIFGLVAVGFVVVVGSGVAVAQTSSRCRKRGCGLCWGAVGHAGSECHHF